MTEHWGVIVLAVIGGTVLALGIGWCVAKLICLFEKMIKMDKDIKCLRKWCGELNCSIQKINYRIAETEKRMGGKNEPGK